MPNSSKTMRGGAGVRKSQLKKLVDNYYEVMLKKNEQGKAVPLDRKKDAQSVWFTKEAIDKMFATHGCTAENNNDYGLRVYFGVHKTGVLHKDHEIPAHYHNQQTVVLVPTKNINGQKDKDLLKNDEDFGMGADGKSGDDAGDPTDPTNDDGTGTNHGIICPPSTGCGCSI